MIEMRFGCREIIFKKVMLIFIILLNIVFIRNLLNILDRLCNMFDDLLRFIIK